MSSIQDKVHKALNETRILVLGAQILLGFQYNAVFQPGFNALPAEARWLDAVALGLMLLALALLLAPVPFHRLVEGGNRTGRMHAFTTWMVEWALLPFALGIGIDIFIALRTLTAIGPAAAFGGAFSLLALFFWYGLEMLRRKAIQTAAALPDPGDDDAMTNKTPLKNRIEDVLTESRVILPGVQALLGFQFTAVLSQGFDRLPATSQLVHAVALGLLALAVILLMAPPAYHRIVDRGEETEDFDAVGSRLMLAAMIPLALALCGDLYIVLAKIMGSPRAAIAIAGLVLAGLYGVWFGYPIVVRSRQRDT